MLRENGSYAVRGDIHTPCFTGFCKLIEIYRYTSVPTRAVFKSFANIRITKETSGRLTVFSFGERNSLDVQISMINLISRVDGYRMDSEEFTRFLAFFFFVPDTSERRKREVYSTPKPADPETNGRENFVFKHGDMNKL